MNYLSFESTSRSYLPTLRLSQLVRRGHQALRIEQGAYISDVSLELLTDNAIERAPSRAAENDGDIDQQHKQRKFIATFR